MAYNNGRKLSTRDRDNDGESWINWAETHGRGGGVAGWMVVLAVMQCLPPLTLYHRLHWDFDGIFGMVETPLKPPR